MKSQNENENRIEIRTGKEVSREKIERKKKGNGKRKENKD
jgi:hypothetical protein